MGDWGVIPGMGIALVLTLLARWLFPGVWAASSASVGSIEAVKFGAWVMLLGFPLSVLFGARGPKKITAAVWCLVFFWPLTALILAGTAALPSFWMRGYDDVIRWACAAFGLVFGAWVVTRLLDRMQPGSWEWLVNWLDRVFGRKK